MAASRPKQGNHDRGWNDPPMFSFSPGQQQSGSPRRILNKRVAFPASNLPPPGHAVLNPGTGPPSGNSSVRDVSSGIPIPKVVQVPQAGNSALPPALQMATTTIVDQDAPLSPVLLPPTADTSMPETVPLLVPAIIEPVRSPQNQSQDPAIEEERLADLLSRLQLQDDSELLKHVTAELETVMDRYCNLLTEKACEDIRRKLELFTEKWKKGSLSESVKIKITHLVAALVHEEIDKANHLHLALMVDHISEVNQWMMGVKRLIQQQQLSLKEKEIASKAIDSSEEQNKAVDSNMDCDNKQDKLTSDLETSDDTDAIDNEDPAMNNINDALDKVANTGKEFASEENTGNKGQHIDTGVKSIDNGEEIGGGEKTGIEEQGESY